MRFFYRLLLFYTIFLIQPLFAADHPDPYAATVDRAVTTLMKANHIPGAAVVLYVNGQPHSYQYGYADQDKQNKVSRFTIFEVGSLTKVMTALLLTQEVDYARMALTDPVQVYIAELPAAFKHISLQDLATHTAGVPFELPAKVRSWDNFQQYFANNWQPVHQPQREWFYSNVGIGLLSIALENATQMQLNELYIRHILNPLRMQPIGLAVPEKLRSLVAQGYDAKNHPVAPVDLGIFPGAYGVKMSVNDMQKFVAAALGMPGTPIRVFYPMLMTELPYVKLGNFDQGLVWQIHPLNNPAFVKPELKKVQETVARPIYNPRTLIDKTGGTNGFRTYVAMIPYRKSAIAIMVNKAVPTDEIIKTGRAILYNTDRQGY